MKNTNTEYQYIGAEEKNQALHFKNLWNIYSFHWPLFLISIALFTAIALVYASNVVPEYNVQAKISLKTAPKSQTEESKAALEELDAVQTPKLAENEVAIIKSRPLMRKVVRELGIWVNYQEPFHYAYKDLYNASPVSFNFIKQKSLSKVPMEIVVENSRRFKLKQSDGTYQELPFNTPLKSRMGTWQLTTTGNIGKYTNKPIRIQINSTEATISEYEKNINIILDKNAPIVDLQLTDAVPERGVDVLNHLITAYKVYNSEDKNHETQRTLKFIDDRLSSLTQELSGAEKSVEDYKSSIGLTDISSQSQFYLDNVQSNDARLSEVNVQLNVINGIEAYLNSASHTSVPATIGIADPGLVSLVDQVTNLELVRTKLLATTPEENPLFAPINNQIASTKEAIKNKVRSIKASLMATKKQLDSYGSNFESSIKHIPGQERKYVSIKRQQGIKENLYIYLLQKREQIGLSYASTLADTRVVEDAYYEKPETSAKYPVAIALTCGLLLPAGFISLRKSLRNRVMTKEEIEAGTSAPIICELIQTNDKDPILVLNKDSYAIGEQLRSLRTNLLYMNNNVDKGKVTLFTSSVAGEGKSFVASNIGASLAASGKKTIILELDLRRPEITRIFNLDVSRAGLSNYLNDEASIDEITQPSGIHPNLFVMRSGSIPSNPSELLHSIKMEMLVDQLRNEYDNVLIDSPPLRLVTDAMILAPLCDVCLYIVRHNFTLKTDLAFIEQVYLSNKLKNMNLVFNGVSMDERFGYTMDWGYYAYTSSKPSNAPSIFNKFADRF